MPSPPSHQAAKPTREIFDPWNSSSTGHQRDASHLAGSMSWRESRTYKLSHQFRDSTGQGGDRLSDLVGAGSEHFRVDGRKDNGDWEVGAPGLREKGWQDIRSLLSGSKKPSLPSNPLKPSPPTSVLPSQGTRLKRGIFTSLTIYINGSTAPLVSDHKLKQLLSHHGANISIALARRSVTHVILGTPNSSHGQNVKGGPGAGGGLAARKIQKEIETVRGKGVKFVGVEWVLDSIEAGKRLPEARFSALHLAPKTQKSVYGHFTEQRSQPNDPSGQSQASSAPSSASTPLPEAETSHVRRRAGEGPAGRAE